MSDYISKSLLIEDLEKVHPRVNGVDVFWSCMKVAEKQPTLDEKEIIRKAFERVVERLKELSILARYNECPSSNHKCEGCNEQTCAECFVNEIMNTVKEEGGIE